MKIKRERGKNLITGSPKRLWCLLRCFCSEFVEGKLVMSVTLRLVGGLVFEMEFEKVKA
jgi:hypothetical protein